MSSSVPAFGSALRKGSGRAMVLLRREPDSPALQAELMRACKACLTYDPQCEHERGPYLHRLIRTTGEQRRFWRELARWLAEVGPDEDDADPAQAFHVLCLLAADDPSLDRGVLWDFARRAAYGVTSLGSTMAFIRLEGIEALLVHVRRFADDIAEDVWSFKYLVEALGEREGLEAAALVLEAARATCPELDRLMALDGGFPEAEPGAPETMDYAAAKEAVAGGRAMFPGTWVRCASPEELAQAARDLLAESDARMLRAYLMLFRRRDFPAAAASLFPFLRHEDDRVARGAAEILGRLGGSDVRALALDCLDGERPWSGVQMLHNELQPGDFDLIRRRLDGATLGADGWHYAGFAVLDLLDDVDAPPEESRAMLLRLYEEEPCSMCRWSVVRRLAASGGLPDWLAEECRHDADPETASLASPPDLGPTASG